ncbi:peptidoglycan-binding protein [Sorangium sp. So ce1335]|uniref:peptidoglycan-binding protein n=1 Tax=Sorangium sp. So ce1335 TaxID=3133335 RepID=UPI003F60D39A
MRPYVVRQGDYLSRLAYRFGFDAEEVWNHPRNQALRERRASPEILAPGDVLYLPEEPSRGAALTPHAANRFRGAPPRIEVEIALAIEDEALAGARCVVEGAGAPIEATADGDGVVRFEVPAHVGRVELVVPDRRVRLSVLIGHLDPHDDDSGAMGRLANLGLLLPGHGAETDDERRARLHAAVARFQEQQGIAVTGLLDDETRSALRGANGS